MLDRKGRRWRSRVQVPFRSDPPEDNSNNHDDQCLVHQQRSRDCVGTLRLLCLDSDHLDLLLYGLPSHLALPSKPHHWPTDYLDSVASSPSGTGVMKPADFPNTTGLAHLPVPQHVRRADGKRVAPSHLDRDRPPTHSTPCLRHGRRGWSRKAQGRGRLQPGKKFAPLPPGVWTCTC